MEQDSTAETGWYGASIVAKVYQDENIHGNDDHYTSYYEAFFYVDTAGIWQFATDSDDASEIEIDGQVVASWYGGHVVSGGWSHSGSINLAAGWHRFIYRHEEYTGAQAARAAFKKPGDTDWRAFSTSELTLKGVCWTGVDGDNLPDSAEPVLGTDPESMDSDGDMLDDWYEAKNGLDPLKPDSNNDGLADYFEVTGVALDVDGDGTANAWDADNDNDGVPDSLDSCTFLQVQRQR